MSELYSQDWEAAPSAPWSLGGLDIARTNSSPMEGSWDVRLATVAGGGRWLLSVAPSRLPADSRRGLRLWARTTFKLSVAPSGGQLLNVLIINNTCGLVIPSGSSTLRLGSGVDLSFTDDGGGALTLDQQYTIDVEWRFERDTGIWLQCWLDGAFRFEHRDGAGSAPSLLTFFEGGNATGKGTVTARWGDTKIWIGQDPS